MDNPLGGMMEWYQSLPSYAQIGIPVAGAAGIFLIAKSKGSGGGSGAFVSGPYGSSAGGGTGNGETTLPTPDQTVAPPPSNVVDPGNSNPSQTSVYPGQTTLSPLPGVTPIHRPVPHPTRPKWPSTPRSEPTDSRKAMRAASRANPVSRTIHTGPVDSPNHTNTLIPSNRQYYHGNPTAPKIAGLTPQYFHGNTTAPRTIPLPMASSGYGGGNSSGGGGGGGAVSAQRQTTVIQTLPSAAVSHPLLNHTSLKNTAAVAKQTQVRHDVAQAQKTTATRKASAAKTYSVAQIKHASLARKAAI